MAFIEGASVDNLNTWISGGGFLGILTSTIWCRVKIKQQCSVITELKQEMKTKADDEDLKEIKKDNKEDHLLINKKIDDLPARILQLIKP
jgi:hypothetical protein